MIAKFTALLALLFASLAYAQEQGTAPEPAMEPVLLQSRSGICAGFAAGSCFQLNTTPPVTILVGAPTGGDGGGTTNPEPPPPPPPPPQASCPADDGSANAPSGTPQQPALLDRYERARTIRALGCKIPGVDYYVGTTGTLQPPTSISNPAIQITGGTVVRCNQANADVTLENIDFTGFSVFIPAANGCRSLTLNNVKFGCRNPTTPGGFAFVNIQGTAAFTLRRAEVDTTTNCNTTRGTNISDPITCAFNGTGCTVEYVWFRRLTERAVTTGCGVIFYRYNFIDDSQPVRDAHQNFLQQACIGGGTQQGVTVQFNTSWQRVLGGAEGWQFNAHANQLYVYAGVVSFEYNTAIATPVNGAQTMSNIVHGFCHTPPNCNQTAIRITGSNPARFANNFFDPSGAFNAFYPGRGTAQWPTQVVFDKNINMNNGATLLPN